MVSAPLPLGIGLEPAGMLAELAAAPGSPGAMAVLTATDPAHLTFLERLDLVRAWERQLAWVAAGQLAAIGALEDPEPGEGADPLPEFVPDWCREEIATALHVTGTTAQNRLDLARELRTRLASTSTALRAGQLTERKAELIARAVRDLDDAVAAAVEAAVLPDAPGFTPPELQRVLARIVLEVDPDGAADRAAEAVRRRRVTDVYPQPDGMGGLWAELPAADAATVLAGLDADADRIKQSLRDEGVDPSDMPDLQARRADALLAWAQRALNEPGSPTVQGRRPHVQVTVPIGTLLGLDDAPGELAGYGPIDADTSRRLAADGIWRRLLTDPDSGALLDYGRTTYHPPADLREHLIARDPRCTFPGCGRAARRCHLDHIHEWRHGGRTCAANLHPLCLRHHTCKSTSTWTVSRGADDALTWTSPTGRTIRVPPPRLHPIRHPKPDHRGRAPCRDTSDPPPAPESGPSPPPVDDPPPF